MNNKIITSMNVQDREVRVMRVGNEDYISLTDIAMMKNIDKSAKVIEKWMSSFNAVEFLGLWEKLNNDNFNYPEFGVIKTEAPKKGMII